MSHARSVVVLVAQVADDDLQRDAGLRDAQFTRAVWGLTAVFLVGLAVLAAVVLSGRRRRR